MEHPNSTGMLTLERPRATRTVAPKVARQAIIVAGGKGIRLRPYTTLIPKPLVPIGEDHSILEIVMRQLAEQGFAKVILAIGHLGNLIRAYVGDGSQWGLEVEFFQERSPLGTIGPALMFLDQCPDNFIVMNGDIITNIDYGDLLQTHIDANAPLTIATYERETRIDFGVLDVCGDGSDELPREADDDVRGEHGRVRRVAPHAPSLHPGTPVGVRHLDRGSAAARSTPGELPVRRLLARHRPTG